MIFANCALDSTITNANEPAESAELNPPQWPKSVTIITSDMSDEDAQDILNGLQDTSVQITSDMPNSDWAYLVGTTQFVPEEHFSSERKGRCSGWLLRAGSWFGCLCRRCQV